MSEKGVDNHIKEIILPDYKPLTWTKFNEIMAEERKLVDIGDHEGFNQLQLQHLKDYGYQYQELCLQSVLNSMWQEYSKFPQFLAINGLVTPFMMDVIHILWHEHMERIPKFMDWDTNKESFTELYQAHKMIMKMHESYGNIEKVIRSSLEAYKTMYEQFLRNYMIPINYAIYGISVNRKKGGLAFKHVKKFKKKMYISLFDQIIPHFRQITAHDDNFINMKEGTVETQDGKISFEELLNETVNFIFLSFSIGIFLSTFKHIEMKFQYQWYNEQGVDLEALEYNQIIVELEKMKDNS